MCRCFLEIATCANELTLAKVRRGNVTGSRVYCKQKPPLNECKFSHNRLHFKLDPLSALNVQSGENRAVQIATIRSSNCASRRRGETSLFSRALFAVDTEWQQLLALHA